jgi:hypothetical protein
VAADLIGMYRLDAQQVHEIQLIVSTQKERISIVLQDFERNIDEYLPHSSLLPDDSLKRSIVLHSGEAALSMPDHFY